jgi:hypothetical protein
MVRIKTIQQIKDTENLFFLTRDGKIEITEYDKLFYYANQWLYPCKEELDDFGRNRTDRAFIRLCLLVNLFCAEDTFKSLVCEWDGERYIVRLRFISLTRQGLDDETLELELELAAMVAHLEERSHIHRTNQQSKT